MRGYNIDEYINKKFNHLTLIKNLKKIDKNNSKLALFKCDCGNIKELVFAQVLNNKVRSCGCIQGHKSLESNLKTCNSLINFYKTSTAKNNKTGYTGITFYNGKYRVRIQKDKKSIHLRLF